MLGRSHAYAAPAQLRLNQWALAGDWTVERGSAILTELGGRIAYRFHARDVHLVMGPATRGASVRFDQLDQIERVVVAPALHYGEERRRLVEVIQL